MSGLAGFSAQGGSVVKKKNKKQKNLPASAEDARRRGFDPWVR